MPELAEVEEIKKKLRKKIMAVALTAQHLKDEEKTRYYIT